MKTLFIINAQAGSLSSDAMVRTLQTNLHNYPDVVQADMTVFVATSITAMQAEIERLSEDLDCVVAVGGDGTVIEVASYLLGFPRLKLGIIPLGTANQLAENLQIPRHVKGALEVIVSDGSQWMDMGRINNRYFALMAGAGIDADIMDHVNSFEKRTLGLWAYVWQGILRALEIPYAVFDIQADDQHIRCRGIGVVVANARNLIGPYFTLAPDARIDDGLLDICIMSTRHRIELIPMLLQVLSQEHRTTKTKGIRHLRAKYITIKSRPVMKIQADGDVIGTTPVELEAIPQAIQVMVPCVTNQTHSLQDSLHHLQKQLRHVIRDVFHI